MNSNQGDPEQPRGPRPSDPTDRSNWHLGIYANSADPRGIIPRNNGRGSTINFGNAKQSRMLFLAFLAIIGPIFVALLLIILLHR
jgi:uncharacterized membrane protein